MLTTKWAGAWIAAALAAAGACTAQSYPNKPVRVIFAFAAGGAGDVIARAYGQKFAEKFGHGWVLDNRGGAGSTLGTELAARAVPDGYTLFQAKCLTANPVHRFTPLLRAATCQSPVLEPIS